MLFFRRGIYDVCKQCLAVAWRSLRIYSIII
uniref:Uncharacterized protein n=1 Tax=Myoviridae sp. ctQf419 TaxID=2825102 RepID=A0A8S5UKP3_9CAUD|nr:MAG TPA: hypothetical protein [Myoviridae sp. ctQf419]